MLISIITVSHNSEKTIARTIESVLEQTYDEIEYIVIDGNSSDDTVRIVKSYEERIKNKTGRNPIIVSEPDNGMYDALNKGAKLAHGELVGQINSDDWYESEALEIMAELYYETNYDVAWGNIRIKTPSGDFIKHAKSGGLWTTTGWCHPAMFSKRTVLLKHPYALESMYDDFDYITSLYIEKVNMKTIDRTISNFSFGGMSTSKGIRDAIKRVKLTYTIYRKYGMSRWYLLHRIIVESVKIVVG